MQIIPTFPLDDLQYLTFEQVEFFTTYAVIRKFEAYRDELFFAYNINPNNQQLIKMMDDVDDLILYLRTGKKLSIEAEAERMLQRTIGGTNMSVNPSDPGVLESLGFGRG